MSGTIIVSAEASPVLQRLRVKPKRVAPTRRAKISFTLSEGARVFGAIDPVGGRAGRRGMDIERAGKQGANSFRVSARKLDAGLYKVTLAAEDPDGNESDPATAFFRVKRKHR
jgi:hypothetical protein